MKSLAMKQLVLAIFLFVLVVWGANWWMDRPKAQVEGLRYYKNAQGVAVFEGRIRNKTSRTLRGATAWLDSPDGDVAVHVTNLGPHEAKPFRRSMEGFPGWGRGGMTAKVHQIAAVE